MDSTTLRRAERTLPLLPGHGRLRSVHGFAGCLEVDPGVRWKLEAEATTEAERLSANGAPNLQGEGAEVIQHRRRRMVWPKRFHHLVATDVAVTVGHEVDEEDTALVTRQVVLDPATVDLGGNAPAQLDPGFWPFGHGTRHNAPTRSRTRRKPPFQEWPMAKLIKCACGHVVRADTEDDVIKQIEAHMAEDHPDLVGKVPREEIRGWIEET